MTNARAPASIEEREEGQVRISGRARAPVARPPGPDDGMGRPKTERGDAVRHFLHVVVLYYITEGREGEGTLSEIRFGEYCAALRSSSVGVPSATRSILRVGGGREGCVIASLSLFVTTWSMVKRRRRTRSRHSSDKRRIAQCSSVRPVGRSAARRAQKFQSIPLAAVS